MEDLTLQVAQFEGRQSSGDEAITTVSGTQITANTDWVIHCKVTDCYAIITNSEKITLFGESE